MLRSGVLAAPRIVSAPLVSRAHACTIGALLLWRGYSVRLIRLSIDRDVTARIMYGRRIVNRDHEREIIFSSIEGKE